MFYRPLSYLYLYAIYAMFGHTPFPYHLAALLIHAVNAILVHQIIRRVTSDDTIGFCTALLYAAAVPVQVESLMWTVGINDLGAGCFMLLSILLFLQRRPGWSALSYFLAGLFKESAIVLPLILGAYLLAGLDPARGRRPREVLRGLVLHLPVLAVLATIKGLGVGLGSLPATHPYAVRLVGPHLVTNLGAYAVWIAQSVFPLENPLLPVLGSVIAPALILILFLVGLRQALRQRDPALLAQLAFLGTWAMVPILVVLFLPNHRFRYYLVYSTPPFLAALLVLTAHLLRRFGRERVRQVLIGTTALSVLLSLYASNVVLTEGLAQKTFAKGTNLLVRRAAFVDLVRDGLQRNLPEVPAHAALLLGGVDLWAFDKDTGPRLWYGRPDLAVYPLESARRDSLGLYIENPIENQAQAFTGATSARKYLIGVKVYAFRVSGEELKPVNLDQAVIEGRETVK